MCVRIISSLYSSPIRSHKALSLVIIAGGEEFFRLFSLLNSPLGVQQWRSSNETLLTQVLYKRTISYQQRLYIILLYSWSETDENYYTVYHNSYPNWCLQYLIVCWNSNINWLTQFKIVLYRQWGLSDHSLNIVHYCSLRAQTG